MSIDFAISSKSNEWYTPDQIIDCVREILGEIDLDSASCAKANVTVKAKNYYSLEKSQNGLELPWYGSVFCNPPYGRGGQKAFSQKMIQEYDSRNFREGILLVNACTSEKWFRPLFDYLICFIHGRVKFNTPEDKETTTSTKGSCLVYFGKDYFKFEQYARKLGTVMSSF